MMGILLKMIENKDDELTSEGLIEFLFAIAIKKLKLQDLHLKQITEKIDAVITNLCSFAFQSLYRGIFIKSKSNREILIG